MNARIVDTVILGGGLTGLSAAYHLRGHGYLLLEKEERVGGIACTDVYDGFRFDMGSHVWFAADKHVDSLVNELPDVIMGHHERSAWVHIYDHVIPAPFQGNLSGLPLDVVSDCLIGYIESVQNPRHTVESFGDWLRASFGEGFCRHFMYPYNCKVWTVPPEELAADWQLGRVDVPVMQEIVDGALGLRQNPLGANAKFCYPLYGGIEAIPSGLASMCDSTECGVSVSVIDLEEHTLRLSDGRRIEYRNIISTIPLHVLAKLLPNLPGELARAVDNLRYTKVLLVNIGLKTRPEHKFHWIYFPESKYPFFRVSFPHNYSDHMCPGDAGSIQAECAIPMRDEVDAVHIADVTVNQLVDTGYLEKSQLAFVRTRLIDPAYVIYDHHRAACRQALTTYLATNGVHCSGRFGVWEYLNMDGCISAGMEAANHVLSSVKTYEKVTL